MASYLDILPLELEQRILSLLGTLDLYFISLTSKEWHQKAWNFCQQLDFHSFYVASHSQPKMASRKHRKWCQTLQSLMKLTFRPDIDLVKLPTTCLRLDGSFLRSFHPLSIRRSSPNIDLGPPKSVSSPIEVDPSTKHRKSTKSKSERNLDSTPAMRRQPKGNHCKAVVNLDEKAITWVSLGQDQHKARIRTKKWRAHHFAKSLLTHLPTSCLGEISLSGCYVYPKIFRVFASSPCKSTLRSLNLNCAYGFSSACMSPISKLSKLQCLSLRGCEGIGSQALLSLRKMTSLTFLDIRDALCIELKSNSISWKHLSTSSATVPTSLSNGYDCVERSEISKYSVFRDVPDFDEDSASLEGHFGRYEVRSTNGIPPSWYTPARELFEAISPLRRLVALHVTEWNRNSTKTDYGKHIIAISGLKGLALQFSENLRIWTKFHQNLESLSFASGRYANYFVEGRHFVGFNLPHLKSLDLTRCYRLSDDAVFSIVNCAPNLETLKLSFCDSLTESCIKDSIVPKLQYTLKYLDLRYIDAITDEGVRELTENANLANSLTRLSLAGLSRIKNCSSLSRLSNLSFLDLSYCQSILKNAPISVLSQAPKLQKLSLRGCEDITVSGIQTLLNKSSSLTSIDLRDCPAITKSMTVSPTPSRKSLVKLAIPPTLRCCLVSGSPPPSEIKKN